MSPEAAGRETARSNLPPRNAFFTGREDVLERLGDALTAGGAAALSQVHAISGLGGIGKTQTAIEYAYRHRDEYDALFWVRATSETDISSGFVEIAHILDHPLKDAKEVQETVDAVKRWLAANTGWLLVFDNADEPEVVRPFLPREVKGHILVTSRAPVFDMLNIAKPIRLDEMEPDEAREFLFKRTARDLDEADPEEIEAADEIAKELGYLPLALEQAAAFIAEMGSSFQDYLTSYSRTRRLQLLEEHRPVTGDYPKSVTTTWAMNFKQVEEASAASADLLRFSAFLHPDKIPLELVSQGAPELGEALAEALENVSDDPIALDKVLEPPRRYSLIRRDTDDDTYNIHRLVQQVIKDGMTESDQRVWAERTVRAVNEAFPVPEFETWPICERLLAHARGAADLAQTWDYGFEEARRLLGKTASYLHDRADYAEAERLYNRALEIYEKALGPDHPDVAMTLNNLALLYEAQGEYAEAEPLYNRALEISEKALGPDHPEFAMTLNNLALLYQAQGKYEEAEPLYKRDLEISQEALGPDDPAVARTLGNLAGLYQWQGKYAEAEPLYKRDLEISEKALGPDHPSVATTLNNLALLYEAQGKYEEAEPLFKRALDILEKALGPDHPDVATTLNNLAALYRGQGKYAEAEPLFNRALAISEKALGRDHPDVATTLRSLGLFYKVQGKYAEAGPLYKRSLEISEKALGPDHPEVATTLNNLAALYEAQGKYPEAEPLYRRALEIWDKALGPEHPSVAATLNNLATLYDARGDYAEAEPLYKRALQIREKAFGRDHPYVAAVLENYAIVLHKLGRDDEAVEMWARAESTRAKRSEEEKE